MALALTLGLKCYYLWELYHARVLVITYTCDFYKRCPFSHGACLNWKKAKTKTKTIQVHLFLYQSGHVCERVYRWFTVSNALERSKQRITYPWCILYLQLLPRLPPIMLCLSKNLIPLLYINFSKIFENHGRTEILTPDEITGFLIL